MLKQCLLILLLIPHFILAVKDNTLPGRVGDEKIYSARFGQTRMFFYMNEEKFKLAQDFIQEVNKNMAHTITKAELDCIVNEVTPVATTAVDPISFDSKGNPIYLDQQGSEIFIKHAERVKKLAEKALGISLVARSEQMSLIMNYDANKFHQDQCPVQYDYIKHHQFPIPKYTIFQDLTLIDWEMGKNTLSGTILEDADSEDRFILFFKNNEIVCNVYTEPVIYPSPYEAPAYPGASTLSPHSPIPPIDIDAETTVGSPKGKRISVAVRGLTRTEEIDALEKRSISIPVDRPTITTNAKGKKDYLYPTGILFRENSILFFPNITINNVKRLPDKNQVEIYSSSSYQHSDHIRTIIDQFDMQADVQQFQVRHLVKKGPGFSNIKLEDLALEKKNYILFIINDSCIPEKYKNYPIGETIGQRNLPWIQLYHFPKDRIMRIDGKLFEELSLTPIDEIMFRDGIFDIKYSDPNELMKKFSVTLHVFALPVN